MTNSLSNLAHSKPASIRARLLVILVSIQFMTRKGIPATTTSWTKHTPCTTDRAVMLKVTPMVFRSSSFLKVFGVRVVGRRSCSFGLRLIFFFVIREIQRLDSLRCVIHGVFDKGVGNWWRAPIRSFSSAIGVIL